MIETLTTDLAEVVPCIDSAQTSQNYRGTLNVSGILGVPKDAVAGLCFDTAHVFTVSSHGQEGLPTWEIRFGGEPLKGERFLALLDVVGPTSLPLSREGKVRDILNDWVIYDEEGADGHAQELVAAHRQLKGWEQLGKEYWDITSALVPLESFTLRPWMVPGSEDMIRPAKLMQGWGDAERLSSYHPMVSGEELLQIVADVYGEEEAHTRIITVMRHISSGNAEREGVNTEGMADDELLDLFINLEIQARNRLLSVSDIQGTYYEGGRSWSRNEKTERFNKLYVERHCMPFTTDDGTVMYVHGVVPDFDINRAYAERTRIYLGNNRPRSQRFHEFDRGTALQYEVMELETVIGKKKAILPGSFKPQELGLVPTVRWSRGPQNTTRRPRHVPEHVPLTSYKQNVLSNAAGYMVLAYLQPHRRAQWRKEARLRGLEGTQKMGPAQAPLIALQQARGLLDNELVREAEALAQV